MLCGQKTPAAVRRSAVPNPVTPTSASPPAVSIIDVFEDGKPRRAEELQREPIGSRRHGLLEGP
jgi:hypothetical protein